MKQYTELDVRIIYLEAEDIVKTSTPVTSGGSSGDLTFNEGYDYEKPWL